MNLLIKVTILLEKLLTYSLRTLLIRQYSLHERLPAMSQRFSNEVLSAYCVALVTVCLLKTEGLKDLNANPLILDHQHFTVSIGT
jgi:branched-subunit amino acid transport protein